MRDFNQKGFTLLELMIVVAIIGIIASIALPSYTDYVKKGRVAEATSTLADIRIKMEQYYQDNRTYAGSEAGAGPCANINAQFFNISCGTPTASAYTLTASGTGDMSAFEFTVNQNNAKTSKYDGVSAAGCWAMSKSGC